MAGLEDDEDGVPIYVKPPISGGRRMSRADNRSVKKVHFLLGEEANLHDVIEVHPLFCELEELVVTPTGDVEWRETARWVKFEEKVEQEGARWSKPHVATLSLHSLFELRNVFNKGAVVLDCTMGTFDGAINYALNTLVSDSKLDPDIKDEISELLSKRHRHLHEMKKEVPFMADKKVNSKTVVTSPSRAMLSSSSSSKIPKSKSAVSMDGDDSQAKKNKDFMRKIPFDAESAVVLIGEYEGLEKPVSAFIRLTNSYVFGDLTEVAVPTRFIFFHIGPAKKFQYDPASAVQDLNELRFLSWSLHVQTSRNEHPYFENVTLRRSMLSVAMCVNAFSMGTKLENKEIGRAISTMLVDDVFHEIAYRGKNREHLLVGLDEFLDAVTVLPPGEWDPQIMIEPPSKVPSQEPRKKPEVMEEYVDPDEEELLYLQSQGLVRTGRLFGGLINDIKRKAPHYVSDITDGFHVQSIASITFLYFASLSPIITFGGLLGDATEGRLAAIESLLGGSLCGLIFSLFSGQPLSLLNATGPVLVFESILYTFCKKYAFYYLTVRFWVGAWMGLFMVILCAFDISAWVCYITRFTEENFALLIASVYVYKAIENIFKIYNKYPMFPPEPKNITGDCFCIPSGSNGSHIDAEVLNWTSMATSECGLLNNGTLEGEGCASDEHYEPNVFLMSVLLAGFTFLLCVQLKGFKRSLYFPYKIRCLVSDFAVFLCIVSMTMVDWSVGVATPKLTVPATITPTWPDRGWITPIFHESIPTWMIFATAVPALLATILLFLDQQITAVIVNRKDNKLKKGCGYHLDLLVLAVLVVLMGYLGLPWHVAGTVICINHVNSLRQESETAAPGDKPQFYGIREQRVTHFFIFLLVGLSSLMTSILKFIPMPVLYGVFMYMGTAPLAEMQFYDRIKLAFMPAKYQPDYIYLRKMPLKRVHIFTLVQLLCFAALWVVKTNETISIGFPLMLVIMIVIRKSLDFFYTKDEMRAIDAVIPPFRRKKKNLNEEERVTIVDPLKAKLSKINISEEVDKSGIWTHLTQGNDGIRSRNGQYQMVSSEENPAVSGRSFTAL